MTLAYGHAGKAKILQYDLASLVTAGALHTAVKTPGTIFTMDGSLAKSQAMYVCIFTCTATVSYFTLPDDQNIDRGELEELAGYLNVFIPFILGLYISLCLARWWSLRVMGLGLVLDACQNVALLMAGMFPGPEWAEVHDQVLKWGLASVSLIVNACREKESIEGLGPKGDNLFTEEEMEIIKAVPYRARAVVMWCWILMLVARMCEDLNIAPGKYRDVAMECVNARNGISLIWTYLRTQLPFAYVHLVTFLVNLNNLVVSVKCGMVLAMAIKAEVWSQCVNQVLFLFIVPPLYQGLLGISHVIHDPFGEDLLDFPVMAFQEYTNESAVVVTASGWRCPALKVPWGPPPKAVQGSDSNADTKMFTSYLQTEFDASSVKLDPLNVEVRKLAKETNPKELRETVQQMDQVMTEQVKNKDELIAVLREQVKGLEANCTGMGSRIQSLENRLLLNAMSIFDGSGAGNAGWCAAPTVAKGRQLPPPM